jgi:hypothetical protein
VTTTERPAMLPPVEVVRLAIQHGQCMNCVEVEGGPRKPSEARKLHRKATPNRPRCGEHWRAWDWARRQREKEKRVRDAFQLSPEDRRELIEVQGGVCPISGQTLDGGLENRSNRLRKTATDHDHTCCPTPPTCGRCTRGVVTGWVNRDLIGRLEQMPGGGLATAQRLVDYFQNPPYARLLRSRFDTDRQENV